MMVEKDAPNVSYAKCWVFAWNNPPENWDQLLEWLWESGNVEFVCGGYEHGDVDKAPRIKGFVKFNKRVRLLQVRSMMGMDVWAKAMYRNSNPEQAAEYAMTANGKRVEFGTIQNTCQERSEKAKDSWEEILEMAKRGDIANIPASKQIIYYNNLKRIAADATSSQKSAGTDLDHPCGIWAYGPPNTGKSTTLRNAFPDCYRKNLTKWWDGYSGESVVVIDDIGEYKFMLPYLKIWGDQGWFMGEVKGNTVKMRPTVVAVTGNQSIDEAFAFAGENDRAAIHKRFIEVKFDEYRKFSEEELNQSRLNVNRKRKS